MDEAVLSVIAKNSMQDPNLNTAYRLPEAFPLTFIDWT